MSDDDRGHLAYTVCPNNTQIWYHISKYTINLLSVTSEERDSLRVTHFFRLFLLKVICRATEMSNIGREIILVEAGGVKLDHLMLAGCFNTSLFASFPRLLSNFFMNWRNASTEFCFDTLFAHIENLLILCHYYSLANCIVVLCMIINQRPRVSIGHYSHFGLDECLRSTHIPILEAWY